MEEAEKDIAEGRVIPNSVSLWCMAKKGKGASIG
jgi:hypothetical protein